MKLKLKPKNVSFECLLSCEHVWNKALYNVKEGDCGDFEGRFEYIGDKGSSVYKCGVRVKDIVPEDLGEWKCDVWQYYDGSNQWRDYASATSKSFQVGEAKSAPEVIREITDEIETMNEKITELLRESVEKIKMRLKSIAP